MKFICIRECTWHHPDFDTPRRLLPDGGRTVYELQPDAPRHLFQPVAELVGRAPVAAELAAQTLKDGEPAVVLPAELEADAIPQRNPNPWEMGPRDSLLAKSNEELLKIAVEYKVEDPDRLPNKVALVEAILIKAGYTGAAVTGPEPSAPEPVLQDPLVELMNKPRNELLQLAAELGIDKPERLGNKANLATAIMDARLLLTKGNPGA
jgi:hypothetical protein